MNKVQMKCMKIMGFLYKDLQPCTFLNRVLLKQVVMDKWFINLMQIFVACSGSYSVLYPFTYPLSPAIPSACYALCSYCKYPLSKYILKAKNNKTSSSQPLSKNTTPCSHPFQSFQCKREAFLPGLVKITCVDRMQHFPSVVPSLLLLYKLPVKRGRLGCEIIVL